MFEKIKINEKEAADGQLKKDSIFWIREVSTFNCIGRRNVYIIYSTGALTTSRANSNLRCKMTQ